jgi:hypothetical protein
MKQALAILTVLLGLGAQACAPASDKLPPDNIMNPRGE